MEYLEIIITVSTVIIAFIIIIVLLLRGKKIKVTEINAGIVTAEIVDKKVFTDKIELLSVPFAGCAEEFLSPPLKLLLKDINGHPINSKRVRIELHDENGLISSKNYSGKISAVSNVNGVVVFDDLMLKKTGQIQIYIQVDNILEVTDDIDVFPPGLYIDFWNETIGSPKYEEKLDRALRYTRSNNK